MNSRSGMGMHDTVSGICHSMNRSLRCNYFKYGYGAVGLLALLSLQVPTVLSSFLQVKIQVPKNNHNNNHHQLFLRRSTSIRSSNEHNPFKSNPSTLPSQYRLSTLSTSSKSLSPFLLRMGKPKSGSIVDSYQTVSVNCKKCQTRLFRYKKKNGTKSNLVKCYIERISEDSQGLVAAKKGQDEGEGGDRGAGGNSDDWVCPNCQSRFGRDSLIHGRPAIKLVGGKIQMKKK